ncbi:rhodanese-like domain-containing protein [Bizionia gelidisalsuginis]|uniref:Rhodanese-like domain-containing protein n=2 Tax=Bizionia TaxID=283785 RepID=A0A8H2QFT6_9FLAO|nr:MULTISPECIES: rhodanese-like domain-containing protein [Bizionia]TYB80372.1 rhodanese-like domain-containing protein [Bizionia saleffrena]TYC09666.1 rhodanese-like domain-containing protein [Bizionia gelidisalsuginis]
MSFFKTLFGSKTVESDVIKVLSSYDFRAQTENKNIQLIDVRTPNEFKSGHIKGAKNIDFFSGKFSAEFIKLNTDSPVYVYCRSGSRSKQASVKIEAMGFTQVYDLKGGITNY